MDWISIKFFSLTLGDLKILWSIIKELRGVINKEKEIDESEVFAEVSAAIQQPQNVAVRVLIVEPCLKINTAFKSAIEPKDIPDYTIAIAPGMELKQSILDDFYCNKKYGVNSNGKAFLTSEFAVIPMLLWKRDIAGLFVLGRMRGYDCTDKFKRFDELSFPDFSFSQAFLIRREKDKQTGHAILRYYTCSSTYAIALLKDVNRHLPHCSARASIGTKDTDIRYYKNEQAVLATIC